MSSPVSAARSGREAPSLDTLHQLLHPDRLLPVEPKTRAIARRLHASVSDLPIISPHGHTDPRWFARNKPFPDPATLFVKPDHYVTRMLYSQRRDARGARHSTQGRQARRERSRQVWRRFAERCHLFRGTPTRAWLDHAFATLFASTSVSSAKNADLYFDRITERLATPEFLPRALYERFNIEAIATTESPLDRSALAQDDPRERLERPRPHRPIGPIPSSIPNSTALPQCSSASARSPARMREAGRAICAPIATAVPSSPRWERPRPTTATRRARNGRSRRRARRKLFRQLREGRSSAAEAEMFRGQMLTEMAAMSLEDGLVMQLHPGSLRNHNPCCHARFGRDIGRGYSDIDRICACAEAAPRPLRQRRRASRSSCSRSTRPLWPRTRAAGRPLPVSEAGPALVVLRQL